MNDPFDILREQLEAAARGRRARRGRRAGLALVGVTLALGASAAAAVVLHDEPSQPLAGPLPGSRLAYSVELRPDLTAGAIGWCASLILSDGHNPYAGGSGCGPAASRERPVIVAGGMSGRRGVVYAVVDPRVAAVELPDGRRIVPRADRGVPAPWKFAVATTGSEPFGLLRYLDAHGRVVPDSDPRGSWAAGRHELPTRVVDADNPPAAHCAIRSRHLTGLRAESARLLLRLPSAPPDVAQPSFLSCATTVFYIRHTRLRAAVLVNSVDATQRAPLLPGMTAEPSPGAIVSTGKLFSARRAGPGWLAAFGGTAAERERLLRVLTATP